MSNGEPQRSMESPVAWPSYKGFPPDRDPVTKKAIDYALKPHGGRFALTLTLALALALALTLTLTLTLTRHRAAALRAQEAARARAARARLPRRRAQAQAAGLVLRT